MTASCRSCVALQIVSKARNRSGQRRHAVPIGHRLPHRLGNLERLRREHRRLVRQADARKVAVGVEPGGGGVGKAREEVGAVAVAADVIAHRVCFAAVQHHQVPAVRILKGLRGRGLRLLVMHLSVNDGREAVLRVAPDVLPDVQDRPAGGVHQGAPLSLELLAATATVTPNAGQDHHVARGRDAPRSSPGSERNRMPSDRNLSLTCGLWMISPVR